MPGGKAKAILFYKPSVKHGGGVSSYLIMHDLCYSSFTFTMTFQQIQPCKELEPFIHSYWELKGSVRHEQWERIYPDGCAGLVLNLGDRCLTDNGSAVMDFGKTYAVGISTRFKDSFIDANTHLIGICLKPAAFSAFYQYLPQHEMINATIEFDKKNSFDFDRIHRGRFNYLNRFYMDRIRLKNNPLQPVLDDLHAQNGNLGIEALARRNFTTVRQLQRQFKTSIGISPKEYSNIVRFQHALKLMAENAPVQSLLNIALDGGYYDQSHLSNEIKRFTGYAPTQF